MIAAVHGANPPRLVIGRPALVVGILGLVLVALGWFVDRPQFFRSYLVAYVFWLAIPLGLLAIAMIQLLTGGIWGLAARRVCEAGAATLWLMALLFVPLLFGLPELYAWARPEVVANDPLLARREIYLNPVAFVARTVCYLAVWIVLARLLIRWSSDQDRAADRAILHRLRKLATIGVLALGLTVSFAAMDWLMSIDAHWYSTVYGATVAMGMVLTAFAFAVVVVVSLRRQPALERIVSPGVFNDLGSLLLAFLMLWTYMAFFQYLLIWSGNLSEEIPWYLERLNGPWRPVAFVVALGGFALPFAGLIFRDLKRNPRTLGVIAGFLLLTRVVDVFWLIEPAYPQPALSHHWIDLAALVGIGGIWLALYTHELSRRPLAPLHDPRLSQLAEGRDERA